LKDISIGICDNCGNRYYTADILRQVEVIATGQVVADTEERVPVDI
jgi:uncharacterized protein (DUF427 family)